MADERITYTVIVDYTKGFSSSDANLTEAYAEFKAHVKERITRDLPARKGEAKAELVSISES